MIIKEFKKIEKVYLVNDDNTVTKKIKLWYDIDDGLCFGFGFFKTQYLSSKDLRIIANYLDKKSKEWQKE